MQICTLEQATAWERRRAHSGVWMTQESEKKGTARYAPVKAAEGPVIVFQVALVALVHPLLAAAGVTQLAVIEARYEQVPALVALPPLLCRFHLHTTTMHLVPDWRGAV